MSFCRIAANMSPSKSCTRSGTRGLNGGHNRSGLASSTSSPKSATPIKPSTSTTASSVTCNSFMIMVRKDSGAFSEIFRRTTSPRRRRLSATSNSRTRSSASSSTSKSLSRKTLNAQLPLTSYPGNRRLTCKSNNSSSGKKRCPLSDGRRIKRLICAGTGSNARRVRFPSIFDNCNASAKPSLGRKGKG